jgi:hypothetical protein
MAASRDLHGAAGAPTGLEGLLHRLPLLLSTLYIFADISSKPEFIHRAVLQ